LALINVHAILVVTHIVVSRKATAHRGSPSNTAPGSCVKRSNPIATAPRASQGRPQVARRGSLYGTGHGRGTLEVELAPSQLLIPLAPSAGAALARLRICEAFARTQWKRPRAKGSPVERWISIAWAFSVVLTCHYTHTRSLVTGSPIFLSPPNSVLRRGTGDR
jgi:hypothetical protein